MKTLVVGGTGMIGGHTARKLTDVGHDVTVAARRPPKSDSLVADYPVLIGDYAEDEIREKQLEPFEAVVFVAGNDIRHVAPEDADQEFWDKVQGVGVPRFVERAKRAGVRRVVQVGSYYHQVRPELAETNPYVRARRDADAASRALATDEFNVSTLNPPSIVGMVPGATTRYFAKQLAWARGELVGKVPDFAPAGGTNYMTVRSLAEAIAGALVNARSGAAYLVGDENLTFTEYFQLVFDASGSGRKLEERDAEHPFMPDAFIVPGRGEVVSYEPEALEEEFLGYRRNDVRPMIEEMVASLAVPGQA
ncbi:NAD(P)-dependent oxidoreductase [Streptomyces sp. LHD-70]|uniref:NAD-dependent epimerase/dehydratase family protein n=1 Tax=Streptomyces sp. LHD-70 TaxID=3072140 RepID=UPI00280C7A30|nr:NAD(P)-dependent oxidoreductase [Streptomyces sp. LHD-70]MDQ8706024.1 NAD(P)-dependent oxidoreductase [Streptomyces sp. LHD-70]